MQLKNDNGFKILRISVDKRKQACKQLLLVSYLRLQSI